MIDLLDLLFQRRHILIRHILHNEECEGPLVKVLHQLVLADDGFHILRQIGQHIIVNACPDHSQDRRDQENKG